jgi:uncharacterized protein
MPRVTPIDAASIVRDAGGQVIGRTRFQKIAYLLWAAGLSEDFSFSYRHYGPYSEDLAIAIGEASLLGLIIETEHPASWGGTYSVYESRLPSAPSPNATRQQLATMAAGADAIALELAATALFLRKEGISHPWTETARRKPEKAGAGGLARAQELYGRLRSISTPRPWPALA